MKERKRNGEKGRERKGKGEKGRERVKIGALFIHDFIF